MEDPSNYKYISVFFQFSLFTLYSYKSKLRADESWRTFCKRLLAISILLHAAGAGFEQV
jgi:hypothetical protein